MINLHIGKAILWGAITIIIGMAAGNLLYLNPWCRRLFNSYHGHPSMKSVEAFGGEKKWVMLMTASGIYIGFLQVAFFCMMIPLLPQTWLLRGIVFGLLIWGLRSVPEAFNQWLLFTYPNPLILVQLVNTFIGTVLFFGIPYSFFVEKMGIIKTLTSGGPS